MLIAAQGVQHLEGPSRSFHGEEVTSAALFRDRRSTSTLGDRLIEPRSPPAPHRHEGITNLDSTLVWWRPAFADADQPSRDFFSTKRFNAMIKWTVTPTSPLLRTCGLVPSNIRCDARQRCACTRCIWIVLHPSHATPKHLFRQKHTPVLLSVSSKRAPKMFPRSCSIRDRDHSILRSKTHTAGRHLE